MKVEEIINNVCNHEISKSDAIKAIKEITDSLRKQGALEFNVEAVKFGVETNDGYLELRLPYGYNKIEGKINKGDKVDVTFIY